MSLPSSPRTSLQSDRTPTLPSKYRVPPTPPRIHRKLYLLPTEAGLLVSPYSRPGQGNASNSGGNGISGRYNAEREILLTYGPKGTVKRCTTSTLPQRKQTPSGVSGHDQDDVDASGNNVLEIGGILGISRFWETSYLLFFLNPAPTSTSNANGAIKIFPPEPPTREFPSLPLETPSHVPDSPDPLIRGLRAIAEREGLLSPDGRVLRPALSRSPSANNAGGGSGDGGDGVGEGEGEGTVVKEVKNVYAMPLAREGAGEMIKTLKGMLAKNKPKATATSTSAAPPRAPSPIPTSIPVPAQDPSHPNPNTTQSSSSSPPSSAHSSADPAQAETPAQVLARALNPARWNLGLGKLTGPGTTTSGSGEEGRKSLEVEREREVGRIPGQSSGQERGTAGTRISQDGLGTGDLGESMVSLRTASDGEGDDDRTPTALHQNQKLDKAQPGEIVDRGMPDADEAMERVQAQAQGKAADSETGLGKRRSFMDGLKVDWGKMNPFVGVGSAAASASKAAGAKSPGGTILEDREPQSHSEEEEARIKQHRLDMEAQAPGVLGEGEEGDEDLVDVEDGVAGEKGEGEVKEGTQSAGQRRSLEAKIVREMVRMLGSGGFFYSLETDLSHSLQYKRSKLNVRNQSSGLLQSLLHKDSADSRSSLHLDSNTTSPTIVPATPDDDIANVNIHELAAPAEIAPKGESTSGRMEEKRAATEQERQARGETWIEPDPNLPLWRKTDKRFFWNLWLMRDFMDAGLHEFIIVIIQGWVQASRFYVPPIDKEPIRLEGPAAGKAATKKMDSDLGPPSTPVDIVLISRRSKDRAGLRFQRRGIDEDGNVANFVETEMIIRVKMEGKWSIFSFVEIRGSIPLFWSQTSTLTDMKPAPKLDSPVDQTVGTTGLHFEDLTRRYGPVTIVNLSELTGKESSVTLGYRDAVAELGSESVRYTEFDFHNECKGMKYENISKLIHQLKSTFADQGYFWTCQGEVMREQRGTFRVNCIDCLDRTNVVQSALARHVLTSQLTQVGVTPDVLTSNIDFVYNDAWANNGDQISKLYAGTSALKGDFTRTGKRDLHGMINDGLNSVARMRRGAIEDFYLQAVISYMVGERNLTVFSEVLSTLGSNDRTNLIRLSRIRAAAIETCTARVLEEGEHRVNGWTVLSPEEPNAKFTRKMEEKVLVLSHQALYVVSFDYNLEKVVSSTRIPLRNVLSLQKGAYILSALEESGRDPAENSGFVVYYRPSKTGTRVTSYSMMNSAANTANHSNGTATPGSTDASNFFAFKVLPREFVAPKMGMRDEEDDDDDRGKDETCREVGARVVKRIRDECAKAAGSVAGYVGGHARDTDFVVDQDIVGLAEAQKATSLVARADYALKRFLWMP